MSNLDFIIAKVRGMRGKMYEGDPLLRLCDITNIADLAAVLAPDQPIGSTTALQRQLTRQHADALHHVARWLDGWEREFFLWMLRRYQVENLKVLLRAWATQSAESTLALYTVELPDPLGLPVDQLRKAASMEELLKSVPERHLSEGGLMGLGDYEDTGRPFFIEAGIDKAYFQQLDRLAGEGASQDHVQKLVRLELDVYNIMTVLRALFHYSLSFNKIRPFLAPMGALGMTAIEQIRHAPDIAAAVEQFPTAALGASAPPATADALELALWGRLYRTANWIYYNAVLEFGAVVAFSYIKRVELANLIRISECVRYGQRGDAVRQKLLYLKAGEPAGAR